MAIPVPASVLFLRLRAFHEQPVAEQARRREALQAAARQALAPWRDDQRVVLEAPDGLAIVGRGDPALALQAAQQAAEACRDEDVAIGLHYGPVKAEADAVGGARLAGEGLQTAAEVAAFANEHPLLASFPFREALAAGSPRRARALRSAGDFVDERMRSQRLYAFDPAAARRRAVWRSLFGIAGVALVLGAGYVGRTLRLEMEAAARPAIITIEIKPVGEVYVDGELKGTAPPLARLSIPAGPHSIELRSGRLKPVTMDVNLLPGEELELKHTFVAPVAPPAPRRTSPPPPQTAQAKAIDKVKSWLDKLK
ncbi:PEGA domain-containing protein [Ramlibacter sp. XY19]|uniref:PEGA domain-containing protein n=1 Tax=Ramlibacter paludis TaxID=2908000 RepID=UPI0023DCE67E|nr:PEGA domain-containing protein [Ramlibacter paludis]MCG2593497.1 PEGA domain-containing protein [Ramlibacter paludis]